ncbi:MAG: aldose epimerase family protein [Rikenellaceae bacterium]
MRYFAIIVAMIWGVATSVCCAPNCVSSDGTTLSGLDRAKFDTLLQGRPVALYVLRNERGMEVCITNFGARIVSIMAEDREGEMRDVVLGFDNIGDYIERRMAIGATVGRYAGRIAGGRLEIDGEVYQLTQNDKGNTLHGGEKQWMNEPFVVERVGDDFVEMSYVGEDGESGFPGEVKLRMSYRLKSDNALEISYLATTDKPTVVNLTNHAFFNLSGEYGSDMRDHILRVEADHFAVIDRVTGVPSGELRSVEGTPMDLRGDVVVDSVVGRKDFEQIEMQNGLDTRWVFNFDRDDERPQISLYCPRSGIIMTTYTTQPSVHISTAAYLNGTIVGRGGATLAKYGGICLETQHPIAPPILRPDGEYRYGCCYKFGVR